MQGAPNFCYSGMNIGVISIDQQGHHQYSQPCRIHGISCNDGGSFLKVQTWIGHFGSRMTLSDRACRALNDYFFSEHAIDGGIHHTMIGIDALPQRHTLYTQHHVTICIESCFHHVDYERNFAILYDSVAGWRIVCPSERRSGAVATSIHYIKCTPWTPLQQQEEEHPYVHYQRKMWFSRFDPRTLIPPKMRNYR